MINIHCVTNPGFIVSSIDGETLANLFYNMDLVTWGSMLAVARANTYAWWLAVFPGAAIFITVTAYNLLGDGLRDALDPKLEI